MVYAVLSILYNLIMILPVLAIKNMILKIIGIVIMSILILWWIYMNLEFGSPDKPGGIKHIAL